MAPSAPSPPPPRQTAPPSITLTGNQLSSSTGSALNADLTGDGTNDIFLSNTTNSHQSGNRSNGGGFNFNAYVRINYGVLFAKAPSPASQSAKANFAFIGIGSGGAVTSYVGTAKATTLNPIAFTDIRINGGAATQGFLQVEATAIYALGGTVVLTRLVFDDTSTTLGTAGLSETYTEWQAVPEPSGLALLALGASGLLLRRNRAQAA